MATARQAVAALQPKIDAAIDRGVAFLLSSQNRDGSWHDEHGYCPFGQTALSLLTLLKAGVPKTHAAVQRALLQLEGVRPTMTYEVGTLLMALAELDDATQKPRMQELVRDLLAWQDDGWPYPKPPDNDGLHDDIDLSLIQYAALGLRAARQMGIDVPARVWHGVLQVVPRFQQRIEWRDAPRQGNATRSAKRPIAGFAYRRSGHGATGAMTTAGIAVLAIAREALGGKIGNSELAQQAEQALDAGLTWLETEFTVERNPGQDQWHYYYLYGLERVGALLQRETLGAHVWYLEGARWLIKAQGAEGRWIQQHGLHDTCFAILFLERATAPVTGKKKTSTATYASSHERHDVWLRAAGGVGGSPLQVWIEGLAPAVLDRALATRGAVPGLRVARAEYLVDNQIAATVAADPAKPWQQDTYPAQLAFERNGDRQVRARLHCVAADAPPDWREPSFTLESAAITVKLDGMLEHWMAEAAHLPRRNLLRGTAVTAQASSEHSDGRRAGMAVDGRQGTGWMCKADDASPMLHLTFGKPIRAGTLVLTQFDSQPRHNGDHDRIERVRIAVNGSTKTFEVTLPESVLQPAWIELPGPQPIRRVQIWVLSRQPGKAPGHCGFAEVALVERPSLSGK